MKNNVKLVNEQWVKNRAAFDNKYKRLYDKIEIENDLMAIRIEKNYISFDFQETNDLKDWFDNVRAFHKQKNKTWVSHNGFYDCATKFFNFCEKAIKASKKNEVVLRGFSKGGGIAQIILDKLSKKYKNIKFKIFIFNSPMAFRKHQARLISKRENIEIHRVFTEYDPVSKVPFESMGYEHLNQNDYIIHQRFWFRFLPFTSHLKVLKINFFDKYLV